MQTLRAMEEFLIKHLEILKPDTEAHFNCMVKLNAIQLSIKYCEELKTLEVWEKLNERNKRNGE